MARLFISYRRSDTGAYADRLARQLMLFQFDAVFVDREGIKLAENFADAIRSELSMCSAVLVLVGKNWANAQDDAGRRRLDDPTDWVRREVALALSLDLPVVPVRFDAVRQPKVEELPLEIASLATRQGYDINGNYFDRDANDLGRQLEKMIVRGEHGSQSPQPPTEIMRQLNIIWRALSVVTACAAVAPFFVPALPKLFWLFPATLTLPPFLFWLYWLGESARPALARTI